MNEDKVKSRCMKCGALLDVHIFEAIDGSDIREVYVSLDGDPRCPEYFPNGLYTHVNIEKRNNND